MWNIHISERGGIDSRNEMTNIETFISQEFLAELLVKYGKGRRSVERQGSESPHLINNCGVIL